MIAKGDPRQLADALFQAGTGETLVSGDFDSVSGDSTVSEYKDPYNRLHFYILDKYRDDDGVLNYRTSVRHLDGSDAFDRGVNAGSGEVDHALPGQVATHNFSVTNTGEATDLFRIKVENDAGWEMQIQHNVIEVEAGQTVEVPVYVEIPEEKQDPANLTFTVTSETDPDQTATETNVLLNDISASGLKALVEHFEENGEFASDSAARTLKLHFTAVDRFEKQEQGEKVIKHMEAFKVLLDHQIENELISDKASNALMYYSDQLLNKWQ